MALVLFLRHCSPKSSRYQSPMWHATSHDCFISSDTGWWIRIPIPYGTCTDLSRRHVLWKIPYTSSRDSHSNFVVNARLSAVKHFNYRFCRARQTSLEVSYRNQTFSPPWWSHKHSLGFFHPEMPEESIWWKSVSKLWLLSILYGCSILGVWRNPTVKEPSVLKFPNRKNKTTNRIDQHLLMI